MVKTLLLLLTIPLLAHTAVVVAQEYRSNNFVDSNPIITMGGGKATSTNFQIISGSGQIIIGENTSSAFISRAGFFYFPDVNHTCHFGYSR
jgi:hypothetical protein